MGAVSCDVYPRPYDELAAAEKEEDEEEEEEKRGSSFP